MSAIFLSLALLAACEKEPEDTGFTPHDSEAPDENTGCEEVTVGYDGSDKPVVGDTWTVWPRCDGVTVMGATVIRVDPAEAASINESEVTFLLAGLCTLSVQVGSQEGYLEVTVGEGR